MEQFDGEQEMLLQPEVIDNPGISPKKILSRAGFALLILAVVYNGSQIAISYLLDSFFPSIVEKNWFNVALTAVTMLGIAFPLYYLLMKRIPDTPKREVVKLKPARFIKMFFICVAAMYIANILSSILTVMIALSKGDTELYNPVIDIMENGSFVVTLIYVAFIAPIMEELIFRKLLLNKLRRFGDITAILMSGIAFGLLHMNLSQFLYATVLGCVFAYITIKTNTIKYSIILHMMINFIGTISAPLTIDGNVLGILIIIVWMFSSVILGIIFFALNVRKIKFEKVTPIVKRSSYFLNAGTILYTLVCLIMITLVTLS